MVVKTYGANWLGGVLVAAMLCLLPGAAAAGSGGIFNFQHYDTGDGLPQVQARAVHQSRSGALWIGTYGGLSRYDGAEFETFTSQDGLPNNEIYALDETADGRLWIGTTSGLCYREQEEEFHCPDHEALSDTRIVDLHVEDENLWVAADNGLYRIEGGEIRHFDRGDGLPRSNAISVTRDSDELVWVGTTEGLAYGSQEDGFLTAELPQGAGESVQALYHDRDSDRLWVGTNSGLFVDDGDREFRRPEGLPEQAESLDYNFAGRGHEQDLWFGTQQGLIWWDGERVRHLTTRNGLANQAIHDGVVDREGMMWFGHDNGLDKFVPGGFTGYLEEQGLPYSFVRGIEQDEDERLWLGTREGVAIVTHEGEDWDFDGAETLTEEDGLEDQRVASIAFPEAGQALIATEHGVAAWDEEDGIVNVYTAEDGLPSNRTQALAVTGNQIWVGTELGVAYINEGRIAQPENERLASAYAVRIREDELGQTWFATHDAGLLIRDEEGEVHHLGADDGVTDQSIWDLARDPEEGMWLGTNGDGVIHLDQELEPTVYTTDDGLPDNFVWNVLVDDQERVWGYTNQGVFRLNPDGEVQSYDGKDGLLHEEGGATGALQSHDGSIWLASAEGLMRYEDARDFRNELPPEARVRHVKLDGDRIQEDSKLGYRAGNLDFEFTAFSFHNEEAVRYRYRLLGVSDEWSEPIPRRPVTFGNLPGGEYQFEVQARNPHGVWSEESAVFSFEVRPAIWATGWFWALILPLAIGLLWLLFHWRIRAVEQRRRQLEKIVRQRTKELEEANRRLEDASITDTLTGLRNRRFLINQIPSDVAQSERAYSGPTIYENRDIVFMMIDLDSFKSINDRYGHSAGDQVLREYAAIIDEELRESDYVVRWGGEEFLVVARNTDAERCNVIAERILTRGRETRFTMDTGEKITCTCSIGICHFPFLKDYPKLLDWEQVVELADLAVYMAKDLGRDGWVAVLGTAEVEIADGGEFLRQAKRDLASLVAEGSVNLHSSFENPERVAPGSRK